MNAVAIEAILALIEEMLPKITSSGTVQKVIDVLVAWMPIIVQFFKNQIPVVQNIIAILRASPDATAAQIVTCETLSAQCDAAFDDALALARAADAAQ